MTEEKSRKIMANNINKYLKLTGKTKADLSRDLGIPYSTVRDWCTGTSYPRIDALDALVKYFNISRPMLTEVDHERFRLIKQQNLLKRLSDIEALSGEDLEEILAVVNAYTEADPKTKALVKMALEVK